MKEQTNKTYLKEKNMLKQALMTSVLLLGSTSQLSASQCKTYDSDVNPSNNDSFFFVI